MPSQSVQEFIYFRCNRNHEKTLVTNSSGTISKTSNIGVGTEDEAATNVLNDSFPCISLNNDTITIASLISEQSISATSREPNVYTKQGHDTSNEGHDKSDFEIENEVKFNPPHKPKLQMPSKIGSEFNKTTTYTSNLSPSDGQNVRMRRVHLMETSSEISRATGLENAIDASKDNAKEFEDSSTDIHVPHINNQLSNNGFVLEEN